MHEGLMYMLKMLYEKAHLVFVVYDVANLESFRDATKRIEEASLHAEEYTIRILFGNKNDLKSERKVTWEEGAILAKQYDARFVETSAKTFSNIFETFQLLLKELMDKMPPIEKVNPYSSIITFDNDKRICYHYEGVHDSGYSL
eukprot:TRINITY_DN102_c0_g3_i2.p4 TRINITY_DN102_c0_g3~~TRINITY_DN102_c0_g3_i2.p4  ORF type:complete len:144 (-),score=12.56 TRINITY_DN102_c0_g3_i2:20-451(-)